jgi:hypothetical protein
MSSHLPALDSSIQFAYCIILPLIVEGISIDRVAADTLSWACPCSASSTTKR